jgi:hypothetical protein
MEEVLEVYETLSEVFGDFSLPEDDDNESSQLGENLSKGNVKGKKRKKVSTQK